MYSEIPCLSLMNTTPSMKRSSRTTGSSLQPSARRSPRSPTAITSMQPSVQLIHQPDVRLTFKSRDSSNLPMISSSVKLGSTQLSLMMKTLDNIFEEKRPMVIGRRSGVHLTSRFSERSGTGDLQQRLPRSLAPVRYNVHHTSLD